MGNQFEENMIKGSEENPENLEKVEKVEDIGVLEPGSVEKKSDLDQEISAAAGTDKIELEKARGEMSQEKNEGEEKRKEQINLALTKLKEIEMKVLEKKNQKPNFLEKVFMGKGELENKINKAQIIIHKHQKDLEGALKTKGRGARDMHSVLNSIKKYVDMDVDLTGFPEREGKQYSAGNSAGFDVMGK